MQSYENLQITVEGDSLIIKVIDYKAIGHISDSKKRYTIASTGFGVPVEGTGEPPVMLSLSVYKKA